MFPLLYSEILKLGGNSRCGNQGVVLGLLTT